MSKLIDLIGHRFGKLRVVDRAIHPTSGNAEWSCLCDCGNKKVVPSGSLRSGKVKSCGCSKTLGRLKDITGQVFGRLTITGFHSMAPNRVSKWNARCSCGTELVIRKSNLWTSKDGKKNTVSCGCHKREYQKLVHTTHGDAKNRTKEYRCWQNMHQRCGNPKSKAYKSYGAKGVTVCPEWSEYESFLKHVGRSPSPDHCIDRIDPYGNYEPSNIRWVTQEISNANKRKKE